LTAGIGNTLKRLRMERKLTQKELAAMVSGGLDYTYIGKIERDEQLPSLKMLIKLAKALAVPLVSFFSEENEQLASLLRSGKVVNLAASREMSILIKELNQLSRGDVPLLIEIVRALNRHRKLQKDSEYSLPEKEYALVAEEKPGYDNGE
jgi:transcriptional regulator with XRE-family HTH domain